MTTPVQSPAHELRRSLPSRLFAVEKLCREVRAFLEANGLAAARFGVELVARECLNNAVVHGNRRQAGRRIDFRLALGRRWIRLEVADEGQGFDWRSRRRTPPGSQASHGRGFVICQNYSDRIRFNQAGNRITVWQRRPQPETPTST